MTRQKRILAVLAVASMLVLAGCATTGGNTFFDETVTTAKVKHAIFNDPSLKVTDISVSTENGVVELSGTVKSRAEKEKAERVARRVEGVKRVRNELKVK